MGASRAHKIRLGIFAVAAAAALAVVLVVFAGLRFWERREHYVIYFDGSVIGLEEGAAVHFGGIRIGAVDDIEVAPDDLRKMKVTIEVKAGYPIRTDTTATLRFAGITGLKEIDLHGGEVGAPRLPPGGTIAAGQTVLDRFERQADELVEQSQQIMTNANRVLENLARVTDPDELGFAQIAADTRTTSANLAATSAELHAMVAENRGALRRTVRNVDRAAARAGQLLDDDVPRLVGDAGGFIADLRALARDNGGYLRSTMFDLRQASRSMKELARELRQQPSRLLFSSAARERKLP